MTLRKGDRGNEVTVLQSKLVALGIHLPRFGVDGIYGSETEGAVKQAQRLYKMPVTGIADQSLLERMGIAKKKPVKTNSQVIGGGVWIVLGLAVGAVAYAYKRTKGETE